MKGKKKVVIAIMAGVLIVGFAAVASADNCFNKLGRGVVNTATGWLEYPNQIVEVSKEYNPFAGLTFGQAKGVGYGVYRTGIGVFDAVTFAIPPYDAVYMQPDFVFGHEN